MRSVAKPSLTRYSFCLRPPTKAASYFRRKSDLAISFHQTRLRSSSLVSDIRIDRADLCRRHQLAAPRASGTDHPLIATISGRRLERTLPIPEQTFAADKSW